MSDDVIRSQLPNDNYRRGWDETFGAVPDDAVGAELDPKTWCKRCGCSHIPNEAHLVDGND